MHNRYQSVRPGDDITAAPPKKHRYVRKEGSCNVVFRHVPEEWLLFVTDIFTTLVEIRWRVMFLIFALSYILSWLFFGILYWVIALTHGDMKDLANQPCVYEVRSFTAAFLFSLETQTTIGYGFRGMSENCMVAIVVVTIQDVISCFIDTFVIGIVVAKMASARKRAQTVGFSSCAVVNLHDGFLCLSWRVGDFRRNHLVEGTARAQLVRSTVHATGKMDVSYEDLLIQQRDVALVTPTTVFHRMEAGSPLYRMGLVELRRADFELVVSFTYTDDTTGMLHQTRTSYTPAEILWGQLFQEMIRVSRRHYRVDYILFNQTAKVLVPEVSAEQYEHRKQLRPSPRHSPRASPRAPPGGSPGSSPGAPPLAPPLAPPGSSPRAPPGGSPGSSPGAPPLAPPGSSPLAPPLAPPGSSPRAQEKLLRPPTVTVELVNDGRPQAADSTSPAEQSGRQQDALPLPSDAAPDQI